MGNAPNILCPRCKELFNFKCNLVSLLLLNWAQKKPFWRSRTPVWTITEPFVTTAEPFYIIQIDFSESVTPVALLIPGVNIPPYSHRFRSLIYTIDKLESFLLLISNGVSDCMFRWFWIMRPWAFGKYYIFNTSRRFYSNNFTSRKNAMFIFEGLK